VLRQALRVRIVANKNGAVMRRSLRVAAFAALSFFLAAARADFPDHALRLVVPFAPGGAVDGAARPAAQELAKVLGQPVAVDNRPGSGGVVGIRTARDAPADGYTLLLGNLALASAPALYPRSGIDPHDFAPVALIGSAPYALIVRADSPLRSVADLLARAKADPGKLTYASAGAGSALHLAGELFKSKAGVNLLHVPYKGAAPAMTALLGGEVDVTFSSLSEVQPMLQAGRVRALAVTSPQRTARLPNVPTLREAGVPDYQVTGWYGLYVRNGLPPETLAKLQAAAHASLRSEAMRQQLQRNGLDPAQGDAREAQEMLEGETQRWGTVIRGANIRPD
jgi:tripartite-type tricarboxylate transporter receptor subunit TctC